MICWKPLNMRHMSFEKLAGALRSPWGQPAHWNWSPKNGSMNADHPCNCGTNPSWWNAPIKSRQLKTVGFESPGAVRHSRIDQPKYWSSNEASFYVLRLSQPCLCTTNTLLLDVLGVEIRTLLANRVFANSSRTGCTANGIVNCLRFFGRCCTLDRMDDVVVMGGLTEVKFVYWKNVMVSKY